METKVAAVSMKNVTKTFGSVVANEKVDLDIYKGEILALLGENGSGKTTLMNMLAGIYYPDEGQIFINGKEEVIKTPKDALNLRYRHGTSAFQADRRAHCHREHHPGSGRKAEYQRSFEEDRGRSVINMASR